MLVIKSHTQTHKNTNTHRVTSCSCWEELTETMHFHAGLAQSSKAVTEFRVGDEPKILHLSWYLTSPGYSSPKGGERITLSIYLSVCLCVFMCVCLFIHSVHASFRVSVRLCVRIFSRFFVLQCVFNFINFFISFNFFILFSILYYFLSLFDKLIPIIRLPLHYIWIL